jgi:hypothetical protein
MTSTFGRAQQGNTGWAWWMRELAPVVVVAGLAADYLSPPEPWTMWLPLGAVVALAMMRKWAHAAAVFVMCSWVMIPVAARTALAVDDARGEARLYVLLDMHEDLSSLREAVTDPDVPSTVGFEVLPVGPGHVIDPRWVFRGVVTSFVELHNAMLIDRWRGAVLDPSVALDRIWIDELPKTARDNANVFAAVTSQPLGIFQSASQWRGTHELFTYEALGDELRVVYPQTRERETVTVRAWSCKEHGMDYCLELSGASRGVKRYRSKRGMEIDAVTRPAELRTRIAAALAGY